MELENWWNQTGTGDAEFERLLRQRLSNLPTSNPLAKLRQGLRINMIWGVVICLFYVFILASFAIWQVQLALALVLGFSIYAIWESFRQYQTLTPGVSAGNSLLEELQRHHDSIFSWMKNQQRIALFFYPPAILAGFLLGGSVGGDQEVEEFMSRPYMYLILLGAELVLVPLSYLLARWLYQVSFGRHLEQLRENIRELKD